MSEGGSVIGISGPSGAGKSTLAARLCCYLGQATLLSMDSYYDTDEATPDDANFCDLQYLKVETFVAHAEALARGEAVMQDELDPATFAPTGRKVQKSASRWLVVEGMVIFRIAEILELCDIRIYLAPRMEAIRERKLLRDAAERGRSRASIEDQLRWVADEYYRDLTMMDERIAKIEADRHIDDIWAAVRSLLADADLTQSSRPPGD
jgi:uridine kinase